MLIPGPIPVTTNDAFLHNPNYLQTNGTWMHLPLSIAASAEACTARPPTQGPGKEARNWPGIGLLNNTDDIESIIITIASTNNIKTFSDT